MKFDFTITISIIIAIIALVSPIITAVINNIHQTRIKKLDIYELAKRESLTNFINAFSAYFYDISNKELSHKAISSMHLLCVYFDIDKMLQLRILEAFNQHRQQILNEVTIELSKQIKKK